ncbi:bifunctional metallophosphatase/5'-nucleotidase [Falsibacillus albus]|uniref:Bifunctional metallophosphatase/5'-nucleotidase n=1 Tax=Falsibacillus albus TaxID=2478915 RepID=A0A3L7K2Q8_9BACI|nr:bifunctional UDP-sugar hydrolase/5'-nucleotidase [Falsibacillus albus]RLQ97100.1 bifunctional metallophosphatase/5'-nucleotidase [Falsibacillus albus]
MKEYGSLEKVIVLATSDLHGHILPMTYGANESADIGLAKIAAKIRKIQSEEGNILLIDNGDMIQGTPLTYHYVKYLKYKPNPLIKVLNHLQYDAGIIGNHEFNYGMSILNQVVSQSNFPWLSANIVHHSTKETYFGIPYITKTFKNGIKAAVLGLTTHFTPNWENPVHIQNLYFEDACLTAKRWVPYIHETEQPDLMIVAYHGGFERDISTGKATEKETGENQAYQICQEVDGIDILLTGHQHRKLEGEVNGVAVLQPGSKGECLGKVTIEMQKVDSGWKILKKVPELLMADDASDKEVVNLVHFYEKKTQTWLDEPIGEIEGDMQIHDPFEVRKAEHPVVELINRVQMEASSTLISSTALFHNGSPGFKQKVTMRDIISNYIYPNTLVVLQLLGSDIKAALERSASYFIVDADGKIAVNPRFAIPKPQHYNYDMWEGIEYVINVAKPLGSRIERLLFNGEPLSMMMEYEVVMNNYRAGGGGGYEMFKGKEVIKEVQKDMTELLADYFYRHPVVKAGVNHNWKVVNRP